MQASTSRSPRRQSRCVRSPTRNWTARATARRSSRGGCVERAPSGHPLSALVRAAAADLEPHRVPPRSDRARRDRHDVAARRHAVDEGELVPDPRRAKDYEFTAQMAKDVRRALDVLLAQPGLDKSRVAIVGHDFGAMWGALAAPADPRVTHFVYMAGHALVHRLVSVHAEERRGREGRVRREARPARSDRALCRRSRRARSCCSSAPRIRS